MSNADAKPLVLITGCSGLLGSKTAERLSSDYRIVGLDIKPPFEDIDGMKFFECDLTDARDVAKTLEQVKVRCGSQIESVLHLAAYYDFSGEPSTLYDDLTVNGTKRLLEQLQLFDVKQFVFSSSLLAVKPTKPGRNLTEGSPTQAEWDYPKSKLDAEDVIKNHRRNIPAVILRLAGAYDEMCHSIPIAQQMARIYEEQMESHFFPGKKEHGQSFVHLDDITSCFEKTIQNREKLRDYEMFLIGEPDVVTYEELQHAFGMHLHGEKWSTIRIPKPMAKVGAWAKDKLSDDTFIKPWMIDMADAHYPVDCSYARSKLGWEPKHRLRDTLETMCKNLRENPKEWYDENGLDHPE